MSVGHAYFISFMVHTMIIENIMPSHMFEIKFPSDFFRQSMPDNKCI
jgi:hypothetical protein